VNRKVKRLALKSALTTKVTGGKIVVLDELKMDSIKTKMMKGVLEGLAVVNEEVNNKVLVVTDEADRNVYLSARNLPGVKTATVGTINTYDILKYDRFVVTDAAAKKITEVYC
jgi:large subunit ribosomal protein L4